MLLIIFILMSASCAKMNNSVSKIIYYRIDNHSSYTIKVISNNYWSHYEDPKFDIDTIVHYASGESRDLVVIYGNYLYSNFERSDTLVGIGRLFIYKNDTIPAAYNYRLTKFWDYSTPDSYKLLYTLEITNASFNH